jgi:ubiquinone/menaquinone biosynthesis C-methylase UbiE
LQDQKKKPLRYTHDDETRPDMTFYDEAAGDDSVELAAMPIRLECCDAADLPYPDNSFDTIIMQQSLCATEQPELALLEASRVLKPDGKIYLQELGRSKYRFVRWYQDFFEVRENLS